MTKTLMRSVVPKAKLNAVQAAESTTEITVLYQELDGYFKKEQWSELTDLLESVANFGEKNGQKGLCLKAQSLRAILLGRTLKYGPEHATFNQMSELFDEVLFHLSHLNWQNDGNSLGSNSLSYNETTY